jgi:hypothetical protein
MRKLGSAVLAAALFASTATFAGTEAQNQGTLAPGGAAGVHKAQMFGTNATMALVGIAIAAAVIAIIESNSGNGSVSTTTTGTP